MKFFSRQSDVTIGALIDIGSASVLVAYVASKPDTQVPTIVWSHREHIPLRSNAGIEQLAKNISTAFMNASLLLENTGRQVLDQALPGHPRPSHLSVTVAAPWSYTVTKTLSYESKEPFVVDDELITELQNAAEKKIGLELKEQEISSELGLFPVLKSTVALLANGYNISSAQGQTAKQLSLARATAFVRDFITNSNDELHDKLFSQTTKCLSSFMLAYYFVSRQLYPNLTEYCLVDITFEGTEIGVVRDGVLQYCSHVPYGAFSLARDISSDTNTPLEEAYGLLTSTIRQESETDQSKFARHYENYVSRAVELFSETGDALTIPKTIILHSNAETEYFFGQKIADAAKRVTKISHHVNHVSNDIIANNYTDEALIDLKTRHDTAALISAQFFHTNRDNNYLEWQ